MSEDGDPSLLETAVESPGLAATVSSEGTVEKAPRGAQVGRTLGRFTLVDEIGSGAMGVVYRADDPELGRSVALKILHNPDAALTERLVREARSMAQISHPNVVTIYDVGVTDGTTYIAMELVAGQTLRAWLRTPRPLAEVVARYVAAGRGLAAAHAAGIVHRDFKPDNVLVGEDGRVRVTDFGLAATRASDERDAGLILGTPAYMAPEQFEQGNIDSRTDQFAFAIALHESLYGTRPFSGRTFLELGDNVCHGKVLPPPAKTQVSRALRAILLRGLSVVPGDRYPTLDAMLDELRRDRARPWRRAAIGSAAVAGVLALGLVADVVTRARVDDQTRRSFAATGVQTRRAVELLRERFVAFSNAAYIQPSIREVSGTHNESDFGLVAAGADQANVSHLHETLASADFTTWTQGLNPGIQAVTDRSGRLLYSTANRDAFGGSLGALPTVKRLITAGKNANEMAVLRNDLPVLVDAKILGPASPDEVSVMFARTIAPGNEVGALYLQFASGRELLDGIRLDDETRLALVTPDDDYTPAVFPLALATVRTPSITDVDVDGTTYQVQSVPILDPSSKEPIARVVMARATGGLLGGLFPSARTVFAAALALALAFAAATALRARRA